MKTFEDYAYDYLERMGKITEDNFTESEATFEAIYQVREDMVNNGMDYAKANMEVMKIRNLIKNNKLV